MKAEAPRQPEQAVSGDDAPPGDAPRAGQQAAPRAGPGPANPWQAELESFVRALGSAYLFGIPLLYTMEMWWIGNYISLSKLLLFLGIAFAVNVMLAYFSGFKQETTTAGSHLDQAVDTLAVGMAAAVLVLLALNQLRPSDPLHVNLARLCLQAVPLSIGASIANTMFQGGKSSEGDGQGEAAHKRSPLYALLNDVGATVGGGLFVGFSIAPTEEMPMLATEMTIWHRLALIALTLVITYAIVFEGTFSKQRVRPNPDLPFQQPVTETVLAYCVALVVAMVVLFLFDQIRLQDSFGGNLAKIIALSMPVAIGGAAGRLLI